MECPRYPYAPTMTPNAVPPLTLDMDVCGYRLGRFLASRKAFIGIEDSSRLDSERSTPVHVRIGAGSDPLASPSPSPRPTRVTAGLESGPHEILDVGRTRSDELVLIESILPQRLARDVVDVLMPKREVYAPMLFDRPIRATTTQENSSVTFPSEVSSPAASFPADSSGTNWFRAAALMISLPMIVDRIKTAVISTHHQPAGLTASSGPSAENLSAPAPSALTSHKRRIRPRVVFIFLAVLVLATVLSLIALGSPSTSADTSVTPLESGTTNPSIAQSQTADQFAVFQARAGHVPSVVGAVLAGGTVTASIVRETGDISLVELTVEGASQGEQGLTGETTVATLLLQREEAGWRLRDIF